MSRSTPRCAGARDAGLTAPDPDPLTLPLRTIALPPRETTHEAHERDGRPPRLELLGDALDRIADLARRAEELLDEDDDLRRLLTGVRDALVQMADDGPCDQGATDGK